MFLCGARAGHHFLFNGPQNAGTITDAGRAKPRQRSPRQTSPHHSTPKAADHLRALLSDGGGVASVGDGVVQVGRHVLRQIADVKEQVRRAVVRHDEAKTAGIVEKLHFTCLSLCRCVHFCLFPEQTAAGYGQFARGSHVNTEAASPAPAVWRC